MKSLYVLFLITSSERERERKMIKREREEEIKKNLTDYQKGLHACR